MIENRKKRLLYTLFGSALLLLSGVTVSSYINWTQYHKNPTLKGNSSNSSSGTISIASNQEAVTFSDHSRDKERVGSFKLPQPPAHDSVALHYSSVSWPTYSKHYDPIRHEAAGLDANQHSEVSWNKTVNHTESRSFPSSFNQVAFEHPMNVNTISGTVNSPDTEIETTPTLNTPSSNIFLGTDNFTPGNSSPVSLAALSAPTESGLLAVTPTPEPEEYLMMLIGIGIVCKMTKKNAKRKESLIAA